MQEYIKFSWQDIESFIQKLAVSIRASNFKPDYLIGIANGGLIPLGLLTKELGIGNILTVSASSYDKDKQNGLNIAYLPKVKLENKKVLLVDEIADTGETLKQISEIFLNEYGVCELKTAVLGINKDRCSFRPDFFVFEESKWVVFPWEKKDFPEYFEHD